MAATQRCVVGWRCCQSASSRTLHVRLGSARRCTWLFLSLAPNTSSRTASSPRAGCILRLLAAPRLACTSLNVLGKLPRCRILDFWICSYCVAYWNYLCVQYWNYPRCKILKLLIIRKRRTHVFNTSTTLPTC